MCEVIKEDLFRSKELDFREPVDWIVSPSSRSDRIARRWLSANAGGAYDPDLYFNNTAMLFRRIGEYSEKLIGESGVLTAYVNDPKTKDWKLDLVEPLINWLLVLRWFQISRLYINDQQTRKHLSAIDSAIEQLILGTDKVSKSQVMKVVSDVSAIEEENFPENEEGAERFKDTIYSKPFAGVMRRRLAVLRELYSLAEANEIPDSTFGAVPVFEPEPVPGYMNWKKWTKASLNEQANIDSKWFRDNFSDVNADGKPTPDGKAIRIMNAAANLKKVIGGDDGFIEYVNGTLRDKLARIVPHARGLIGLLEYLLEPEFGLRIFKRRHHTMAVQENDQDGKTPLEVSIESFLPAAVRLRDEDEPPPMPELGLTELGARAPRIAITTPNTVNLWTASPVPSSVLTPFQDLQIVGDVIDSQLLYYQQRHLILLVRQSETTKTCEIWELLSGTRIRSFESDNLSFSCACFAVLNTGLMVLTGSDNGQVWMWKIDGAEAPLYTARFQTGTTGQVRSLAFDENNQQIAAAVGSRLYVWNLSSTTPIRELPRTDDQINAAPISLIRFVLTPEGTKLIVGGENFIEFWDISALSVSVNSGRCIEGTNASSLFIAGIDKRKKIKRGMQIELTRGSGAGQRAEIKGLTDDENDILKIDVIDQFDEPPKRGSRYRVWAPQREDYDNKPVYVPGTVTSIDFDPLTRFVAIGTDRTSAHIWNGKQLQPVNTADNPQRHRSSVAFLRRSGHLQVLTARSNSSAITTFDVNVEDGTSTPANFPLRSMWGNVTSLSIARMPIIESQSSINLLERMGFAIDVAATDSKQRLLDQRSLEERINKYRVPEDDSYVFTVLGQEAEGVGTPKDPETPYSFVKVAVVPKSFHDLCAVIPRWRKSYRL